MRLHELFDSQDQLLEEQEDIFFEVLQAGGEITEEQQIRLDYINQELENYSNLILQYPEKIGYLETKLQKDIDYAEEWQKRFYNMKKAREKKKENLRAWVGRTIRNAVGEGEKIKGTMVTIKDISNPKYREVVNKTDVPLEYQDATFKIPYNIFLEIPEELKEKILGYQGSNQINESRIKKAEICPAGVNERINYNCQFWGLNKIKDGE